MGRKYLEDIGFNNTPDTFNAGANDEREEKWKNEREVFGFDERETWNLDSTFYIWLYERLKMYLDVTIVDLDYHKFDYNGKEYTQRQMIDMMLERLETALTDEYYDLNDEKYQYVHEIEKIWSIVLPAMWW